MRESGKGSSMPRIWCWRWYHDRRRRMFLFGPLVRRLRLRSRNLGLRGRGRGYLLVCRWESSGSGIVFCRGCIASFGYRGF